MDVSKYDAIKRWLIAESMRVEKAKRPEYTIEDADVLANFKRVGEAMGISPHLVAGVYARKHEDALARIARNPKAETSEPVIGRFADRLNYLSLQLALLIEAGYVTLPDAYCEGDVLPCQLELPFGDPT
jgi:hypothetical protein